MGDTLDELRLFREKISRPAVNTADAPQRGHRDINPALVQGLSSDAKSTQTSDSTEEKGMLGASKSHSLKETYTLASESLQAVGHSYRQLLGRKEDLGRTITHRSAWGAECEPEDRN